MSDEPKTKPELWQLYGAFWKVPLHVTLEKGIYRVSLRAIRLLTRQKHEVIKLISQHGTGEEDTWWIMPKVLEMIAEKHDERTDPELLLVWIPGDSNDRNELLGADMAAFIKGYCEAGSPFPEHIVAGVWMGMCKRALHCLINLQRPVPLGFCTLYPLQFRSNWCDMLLSDDYPYRDRQSKRFLIKCDCGRSLKWSSFLKLFKRQWRLTPKAIVERGKCEEMVDGRLVAQNEDMAQWSIGIERHEPWFEQIRATEAAKLKKYGETLYWKSVRETLKRQIPYALRLYSAFLKEATLPGVALSLESFESDFNHREARIQKAGNTTDSWKSLWGDSKRYDALKKGANKVVPPEVSPVSSLPDIQPPVSQLRYGWERPDMEKF